MIPKLRQMERKANFAVEFAKETEVFKRKAFSFMMSSESVPMMEVEETGVNLETPRKVIAESMRQMLFISSSKKHPKTRQL